MYFHCPQSEKWLTYELMREELLEKIRRLEEERQTADLCSTGAEWGKRKRRRQVINLLKYIF